MAAGRWGATAASNRVMVLIWIPIGHNLMDIKQLAAIVHTTSKPLGFRRKLRVFWHPGAEITTMIQLQPSLWDAGLYVNFGAIPTALLTRDAPPSVAYWPLQERLENFDSPFRETFAMLASGDESVEIGTVEAGVRWLIDWLVKHIVDEGAFRKAMSDKNSWLMRRGPMHEGIWGDWYRNELKSPAYYFKPYK